jgi:hypothetical protein
MLAVLLDRNAGPGDHDEWSAPDPAPAEGGGMVFVTLLAGTLLVFNAAVIRDTSLTELHSTWRYWDDMAVAAGRFLDGRGHFPNAPRDRASLKQAAQDLQRIVEAATLSRGTRAWEFWRVLPPRVFRAWTTRGDVARFEDAGRSLVLGWAMWWIGGVSPYLLLWLGLLWTLPVILWACAELGAAGRKVTGPALIGWMAVSPYVVETLTLPHSAVAFYLGALLVLVALSAYAVGGHDRSRGGLLARVLAAGCVFGVSAVARSSTLLLLPGFALALHWASRTVLPERESTLRRAGATVVLLLLFITPYLALRPPAAHNVWTSLWEGLGDFGSDRGYSWYDTDAKRVLEGAGLVPFADPKDVSEDHERHFRDRLMRDLRSHPAWFAGILARRLVATVGLTHLLPWGPVDGQSLRAPRFHYKYTTPVDWFGIGEARLEVPVPLLWLPASLLLAVFLGSRHGRSAPRRRRAEHLLMLTPVALGALGLPVLVTTAGGVETQAFAVVYFLAAGLLLEEVRATAQAFAATRRARAASTPAPGIPRQT